MAATAPATKPARPGRVDRPARTASPPAGIPGAVSRTADAVSHIPDLGVVQRMARGRTWILVLGILLAGIVAINVVTLSFTASTGEMEQRATALEQQNSALRASLARQLSNDRVEAAAVGVGMVRPAAADYRYVSASTGSAALAAERAAAASDVSAPVIPEGEVVTVASDVAPDGADHEASVDYESPPPIEAVAEPAGVPEVTTEPAGVPDEPTDAESGAAGGGVAIDSVSGG